MHQTVYAHVLPNSQQLYMNLFIRSWRQRGVIHTGYWNINMNNMETRRSLSNTHILPKLKLVKPSVTAWLSIRRTNWEQEGERWHAHLWYRCLCSPAWTWGWWRPHRCSPWRWRWCWRAAGWSRGCWRAARPCCWSAWSRGLCAAFLRRSGKEQVQASSFNGQCGKHPASGIEQQPDCTLH